MSDRINGVGAGTTPDIEATNSGAPATFDPYDFVGTVHEAQAAEREKANLSLRQLDNDKYEAYAKALARRGDACTSLEEFERLPKLQPPVFKEPQGGRIEHRVELINLFDDAKTSFDHARGHLARKRAELEGRGFHPVDLEAGLKADVEAGGLKANRSGSFRTDGTSATSTEIGLGEAELGVHRRGAHVEREVAFLGQKIFLRGDHIVGMENCIPFGTKYVNVGNVCIGTNDGGLYIKGALGPHIGGEALAVRAQAFGTISLNGGKEAEAEERLQAQYEDRLEIEKENK